MRKPSNSFVLAFCFTLICLSLHAQTAANPPAEIDARAVNPTPPEQAPDEMTKKITDLVHDGKYAEAKQLTLGLLVAYPNDPRLIKAKALIEKLLSPAGSITAAPSSNQQINGAATAQRTFNPSAESLTGMERVDYNALVELARQAQQTADLPQQNKLLQQFMDQSSSFLQKHPDQTLLWQLRGTSAMVLNDPIAGYEAGEKLLAMGAADSNDSNLQRLLAQLKNKGWLNKESAEKHANYDWIVGTWSVSWSVSWHARGVWPANFGAVNQGGAGLDEEFSIAGTVIEGYEINSDGLRSSGPNIRGTILDSGQIRWERSYSPSGSGSYLVNYHTAVGWNSKTGTIFYPSGNVPVISCVVSNNKRTMTMVIPSQDPSPTSNNPTSDTVTVVYTKKGDTQ